MTVSFFRPFREKRKKTQKVQKKSNKYVFFGIEVQFKMRYNKNIHFLCKYDR